MTASGVQVNTGRGRRIIERPRLIKLLDETEARTILLLAPAGYGKTTLARQWLKGFSETVTITLSRSHRDAAWLAEEFARAAESRNAEGARLIREHVRAHPNSSRNGIEFGSAIASVLRDMSVDWLFLDNYEEITASPEAEATLREIEAVSATRLLVASRSRPRWLSERRTLYGEAREITHDQLAMTHKEIADVIGKAQGASRLAEQAEGWPAVIGLAANLDAEALPATGMPGSLHRYLAEEIFSHADPWLRERLFSLALLGTAARRTIEARSIEEWSRFVEEADSVGFGLSDGFQLHPLLREFLLDKILEEPDCADRLREAVGLSLDADEWETALELVTRFRIEDLEDPALRVCFKPLARSGRMQSLKNLAKQAQLRPGRPKASVDVVLAEAEFCDGNFELASEIAQRALVHLDERHPLASRAAAIVGQIALFAWDFPVAEEAFTTARVTAQDERDESEALYGLAQTTVLGESPRARNSVDELMARRHRSPSDLLRAHGSHILLQLAGGGGLDKSLQLGAIEEALPRVADPRVRSATTYIVSYGLASAARYTDANAWIELFLSDARQFGLEFAMPYGLWVVARTALGQRRHADAERALQSLEDIATRNGDLDHLTNACSLRARMLLQSADIDAATRCISQPPPSKLSPAWRAEYLATRALVRSVAGETREAVSAANEALSATRMHEVVLFARVAMAIAAGRSEEFRNVVQQAERWNTWDPVVCGARSSTEFAHAVASDPVTSQAIEALYSRIQDISLARRAGFRTRSTRTPDDLLSPREIEVLGLVARGYTNRAISRALYIADSTTKVHIRHIFEKLGVRTRAEAVARYEMFRNSASGDR